MNIKIRGDDIEGVFSSIDYYQSIATSTRSGSDIRKGYLDSLLDEYESDLPQRLKKVYTVNEDKSFESSLSVSAEISKSTDSESSISYVEQGVFLDDCIISEGNKIEESPNGVFLDDLDIGVSLDERQSIEYESEGVILDDVIDAEENDFDESEEDDFDESDWGADDSEDDEIVWSGSDSYAEEDTDDLSNHSDGGISSSSSNGHTLTASDDSEIKSVKSMQVDLSDDFDIDDRISSLLEEVNSSSSKKSSVTERKPAVKSVGSQQRDVKSTNIEKESYSTVRDFVKKHQGCSAADIKKFFSSRDIQRALMSSKIVEKRGKYYIV